MEFEYFTQEARQYRFNKYAIAFHTEEVAMLLEIFASTGDEHIESMLDEHAQALEALGQQQSYLETQIDLNQVTQH
jgi:hypothetical protein